MSQFAKSPVGRFHGTKSYWGCNPLEPDHFRHFSLLGEIMVICFFSPSFPLFLLLFSLFSRHHQICFFSETTPRPTQRETFSLLPFIANKNHPKHCTFLPLLVQSSCLTTSLLKEKRPRKISHLSRDENDKSSRISV